MVLILVFCIIVGGYSLMFGGEEVEMRYLLVVLCC